MSKRRYVLLSMKKADLDWQVISEDVVDPEIKRYKPGFFAIVEETNTVYIFRVSLG